MLGGNRLYDSILTTIFHLSSLQILDVNTNLLSMALPAIIGNTLPRLGELGLHNNMFHGHIPTSLGNASFLTLIDLTSNNFTVHVPSSLGKLLPLEVLKLEKNKLHANDSNSWEFLDSSKLLMHLERQGALFIIYYFSSLFYIYTHFSFSLLLSFILPFFSIFFSFFILPLNSRLH
jgi:Leucine-rich repeat (LRR) protein